MMINPTYNASPLSQPLLIALGEIDSEIKQAELRALEWSEAGWFVCAADELCARGALQKAKEILLKAVHKTESRNVENRNGENSNAENP